MDDRFEMLYRIIPSPIPNEGYLLADHSKEHRGGHLGHALAECRNGDLLAFYPNCSADNDGHSGVGWMQYRRSSDGGATWGEAIDVPYSRFVYSQRLGRSVMCEKAVTCEDGTIILFHLICDISCNAEWQPYGIPSFQVSRDNGRSFFKPELLSDRRGRVYDAVYKDGMIYVLEFCNDAEIDWTGNKEEHRYHLYVSDDQNITFSLCSVLPMSAKDVGYGTMEFLEDGSLIIYTYNLRDEHHLNYLISKDKGKTWGSVKKSYFKRKIRNPQMIRFGQGYMMHGRSGNEGADSGNFVLYYSRNGIDWDEGRWICRRREGLGAYSNSIVTGRFTQNINPRLMIHASQAYEKNLTNDVYWFIEEEL